MVLAIWTLPCRAQPSNMALLDTLAIRCLSRVPVGEQSFVLRSDTRGDFLRAAIVNYWLTAGRTLYQSDSTRRDLPVLAYQVDDLRVVYHRARRGEFARRANLSLRVTFIDSAGRILAERNCTESAEDVIPAALREHMEAGSIPEARSDLPAGGWVKRYIQPAIVASVVAVTAYLFFTLRSGESAEGS